MKAKFTILLIIFIFGFIASCQKTVVTNPTDELFTGTWIKSGYEQSITVMVKADSLVSDNYGFTFLQNGDFIERKNAGWCGTPPISYGNFKGTWKKTAKDTIEINVAYWGGMESYKMAIVSLTKDVFKYTIH
ncbi:MAG: hypothetical protein HW421_1113 [Ignavibacteria bacterium]|nr:hypothetical protein [Ignavibacteria bacterium]